MFFAWLVSIASDCFRLVYSVSCFDYIAFVLNKF